MKPHPLSVLITGLLMLPLVTPSPILAQSHSSKDWCSGLRVPTDPKEKEARCVMLKATSAYLEERSLSRPSNREFEQALKTAGIDPAQEASCWGFHHLGTFGVVFSSTYYLTLYQSELACQSETPLLFPKVQSY